MRLISISIFFFVFFLFAVITIQANASIPAIPNTDMENYLQMFFNVLDARIAYEFGLNSSAYAQYTNYQVYVTLSNSNGVGVEFFPSNDTEFHFSTVDAPIDRAVFPSLNFNVSLPPTNASILNWNGEAGGTMFEVGNSTGDVMQGLVIVTNNGHFLNIGQNGEIYLYDVSVDGRYYYALILRGGNTHSWNQTTAQVDANQLSQRTFLTYQQAESIKESAANPVFQSVLSEILFKDRNTEKLNYTFNQHDEDMASVRELAVNTYHFQPTYVDQFIAGWTV